MKKTKLFLLVVCSLLLFPTFARAEWFLDFYAGRAMPKDTDVDASIASSGLGFVTITSHSQRVDFDPSFTFGSRFGYWLDAFPYVGFSLDLSYFEAEDENVDINAIPLSLMLMLRWPLFKNEKLPYGRIQPYGAIGPSLFFYHARADFRPSLPGRISSYDVDIGIDMRAGLSWQLHKHWAIFGEYRYTDIKVDFTNTDFLFGFAGSQESINTHSNTNHLLAGVSYRF